MANNTPNFISFLFSGIFRQTIFQMILISTFIVLITFAMFSLYTGHGESITVPDLRKQPLDKVAEYVASKGLRYAILDSTFVKEFPPNTVIEQNPKPNEKVKANRRIYLTINSIHAPMVKLPDLMYATMRDAETQLASIGLEMGNISYIPDPATNAVLDVKYNGASIKGGTEVPKGSAIDLVLGNGVGDTQIEIPHLEGLTLLEAKLALKGLGLNIGTISPENLANTNSALVTQQNPPATTGLQIHLGEPIDLFVKPNPNPEPTQVPVAPEPIDTSAPDTQ